MGGQDQNAEFEDIVDEVEEDLDFDDDGPGFSSTGGDNLDDDFFDAVIGQLEEVIMGDGFNQEQNDFMTANCSCFDREGEMKLEYTEIFQQYTALIEDHIERALTEGVQDFAMDRFLGLLESREDEVSADVFDMLLSLSDFEIFRLQMCEFKEQCLDPQADNSLGGFLCISGCPTIVHEDEQEDGDARPELNCFLQCSGLSPTPSPQPSPGP